MTVDAFSGTGLVLSGGGAKGAYQAGIIRGLAELDVSISAVSGASIGALNGAVVASSGSIGEAAKKLAEMWRVIAESPPLSENTPPMVQLLESTGIRLKPDIRNRAIILDMVFKNIIPTLVSPHKKSLIDNDVIRRVLGEYLTMDDLAQGLPLYVSVFSNDGYIDSIVGSSLAFLGVKGNKNSEFLRIQDLPPEDMWKALLASAAIPILLEQQEIGGERYIDGGLGGMLTAQGNTPISPLIENGCNPIIVTSLSDRLAWKKQESKEGEFHDVRLIGIDREESIDRNLILPEVFDVLSFTPRKISSWIRQGYDDAIRCVKPHLFLLKREPRQ